MIARYKKGLPTPFSLARKTKKSLLRCFESYQSYHYSQRHSRKRMVDTFLVVNIFSATFGIFLLKPEVY